MDGAVDSFSIGFPILGAPFGRAAFGLFVSLPTVFFNTRQCIEFKDTIHRSTLQMPYLQLFANKIRQSGTNPGQLHKEFRVNAK